MKKVLALLVIGLLLASSAFAAPATVTSTTYGSYITGGTDETLIYAGLIRVKTVSFVPYATTDIAYFKEGAVSHSAFMMKNAATSNAAGCYMYFGEVGAEFNYLSVTLTDARDIVYIYNK